MGFVYVVSDGNVSKIGRTWVPKDRIYSIKREIFRDSKIVDVFTYESLWFKEIENESISILPERFKKHKCKYKNEAFIATMLDVVSVINESIELVNMKKFSIYQSIPGRKMFLFRPEFKCK